MFAPCDQSNKDLGILNAEIYREKIAGKRTKKPKKSVSYTPTWRRGEGEGMDAQLKKKKRGMEKGRKTKEKKKRNDGATCQEKK